MNGIMGDMEEKDEIADIEARLYEAQKFKKKFSMEAQAITHCVQTGAMLQDLVDSFQGTEITLENRKVMMMLCRARNTQIEIDLDKIIKYNGTKQELVASVENYNQIALRYSLEFFSTIKNRVKEFFDRHKFENEENIAAKIDKFKGLVETLKQRAKREAIPRIRILPRGIAYALQSNKKLTTLPEIRKNFITYTELVSDGFLSIANKPIDMESLNKVKDNLTVTEAQKLYNNWYGISKGYCDRTIKQFNMKKYKETNKGVVYLNENMGVGDNTWAIYSYRDGDPDVESYEAYERGLCFEFKIYDNNKQNPLNYIDLSNPSIKDLEGFVDDMYTALNYSSKITEKFEKGGLDLDQGYSELSRLVNAYKESRDKKYILYSICAFIGLNNLVTDLYIRLKMECSISIVESLAIGYEVYRASWS